MSDPLMIDALKLILGAISLGTLGTFFFKFLFERWAGSIEERFKAHEQRMNTVERDGTKARDELRQHFDDLHTQTRNVWHEDVDRINGYVSDKIGEMRARLDRSEKDIEIATREIKETAAESREATEGLRKEISDLKVAVTDLTATLRQQGVRRGGRGGD